VGPTTTLLADDHRRVHNQDSLVDEWNSHRCHRVEDRPLAAEAVADTPVLEQNPPYTADHKGRCCSSIARRPEIPAWGAWDRADAVGQTIDGHAAETRHHRLDDEHGGGAAAAHDAVQTDSHQHSHSRVH
jgi:hypothetical protein